MSEIIIILLKVIIAVSVVGFVYYLWKTRSTKNWNNLLRNKQIESGTIELKVNRYRLNYIMLGILMVVTFFTLRSPLEVASILNGSVITDSFATRSYDAQVESLTAAIGAEEGNVYIVEMKQRTDTEEFHILTATNSSDLADYYTYKVDVVEEVYATDAVMFSSQNSTVILEQAYTLSLSGTSNIEYGSVIQGDEIQYSDIYLIVGGYIDNLEANQLEDERLQDGLYVFTWEAILLEGYDKSKPLSEQSEDIRRIVEEYTKDLP